MERVSGSIFLSYNILFEDDSEDFVQLSVPVTAIKEVDHNYGADADGNRGREMVSYEDVEVYNGDIADVIRDYISSHEFESEVVNYMVYSIDDESFEED